MERITFRPSPEDEEIIRRILEKNPALRGNTSAAIRVALETWLIQHPQAEQQKVVSPDEN